MTRPESDHWPVWAEGVRKLPARVVCDDRCVVRMERCTGRYIDGQDRTLVVLFPERLDEWIDEDNPVRAVDLFVDELNLSDLGFERALPAETGRPGYFPGTLLKIYL